MNLRLPGVLLATALLAACGGQPARVGDGDTSVGTKTPRKSAVVQKRGGGYYKDDGPGDDIPDNLDEIPDAEPRLEPLHRFANRPYVVLGKSYTPDTALRPLRQRGIGSWYGKKFHGQKTSIGEPYDMFAMTAAHPTLAIPSYARVTNVATGQSVVVRVTDRGPFHADRVIDLSYTAAYKLGLINGGSGQVEVVDPLLQGHLQRGGTLFRPGGGEAAGAHAQDADPVPGAAVDTVFHRSKPSFPVAALRQPESGRRASHDPIIPPEMRNSEYMFSMLRHTFHTYHTCGPTAAMIW